MQVTLEIPDEVASRLTAGGGDLSRRALEGLALHELRTGRITELEFRKMLGLSRMELDGYLKAHGIYMEYSLEDFEQERTALREAGR